jgi:hypothetical protein
MSEPRSLPPRPDLRRLRDEAKRRRREGEFPSLALAQLAVARELVERGAALAFRDRGSAIGAALHGSHHCHEPEGGPSMRTLDEIPTQPYAEIVQILLAAGAPLPERVGDGGTPAATLIAELGLDPPV